MAEQMQTKVVYSKYQDRISLRVKNYETHQGQFETLLGNIKHLVNNDPTYQSIAIAERNSSNVGTNLLEYRLYSVLSEEVYHKMISKLGLPYTLKRLGYGVKRRKVSIYISSKNKQLHLKAIESWRYMGSSSAWTNPTREAKISKLFKPETNVSSWYLHLDTPNVEEELVKVLDWLVWVKTPELFDEPVLTN